MNSFTIKKSFLDFYESKKHFIVPNQSLIPENDPSTLFIIAGVHPIVPFILAGKHPSGKRLCNLQRCFRTIDIDEVGDKSHLTLLEMLGSWSLGDYFKEESLTWGMEFLVEKLKIDPKRLYATVYGGKGDIKKDIEAITIWKNIYKKYGLETDVYDEQKNNKEARIFELLEPNFWGPAGETGPCGPSSEIHYYLGKGKPDFSKERPGFNDSNFLEIWNHVFMQYNKNQEGKLEKLKQFTVDTGMGSERVTFVLQMKNPDGSIDPGKSPYDTDLFDTAAAYLRTLIEDESVNSTVNSSTISEFDITKTNLTDPLDAARSFRIVLDHIRSCVYLLADGVVPSNKDQGYMVRRLLRRAIRHAKKLNINQNFLKDLGKLYIEKNKLQYPHFETNKTEILNTLEREEMNFEKVILRGNKELDRISAKGKTIDGNKLFEIYETYGLPLDIALDHLFINDSEKRAEFEKEFNLAGDKHQKNSRMGAESKFKGGLADNAVETTRYHTTTHLLLKALQLTLGKDIHQKGSNITSQRLRFDFSYPEKLTDEQIKSLEDIVNKKIEEELIVEKKIMDKDEAVKFGAEHEFKKNYPDKVSVYIIKNDKTGEIFSKEFCGGPHVSSLKELKTVGKFKIIKQESVGSGVRRVKARIQ